MPIIYLSPSTQEWNQYVTGSGSEEYNMNLLADALVPYLLSNGIQHTRNTPDMTAASSIRQANQGYYDFYLALHSNAAPEGQYGEQRGIIAFYYPGSAQGQRAAELIAEELRVIYPLPNLVTTRATTTLGEVRLSRAPAVLVEIGYHDNYADATWVESHMDEIAQNVDRILVLKSSHILMQGTPKEVFARGKELLEAGLDVPQVTRVAMALRDRGLPIDPAVYTVADLEKELLALRKGGAAC